MEWIKLKFSLVYLFRFVLGMPVKQPCRWYYYCAVWCRPKVYQTSSSSSSSSFNDVIWRNRQPACDVTYMSATRHSACKHCSTTTTTASCNYNKRLINYGQCTSGKPSSSEWDNYSRHDKSHTSRVSVAHSH